jgi:hypothetical protein
VILGLVAVHLSCPAQIDPRCIGSVVQAASGPTGLSYSDYFDRYGLRYYREAYPGLACGMLDGVNMCDITSDFHASDVYFPDPSNKWI